MNSVEILSENFSNELKSVLKYINDNIVSDYPTLSVGTEYFLLGVLEYKDCLAYKILDNTITSITIENIKKAYYEYISKTCLSAIKPNRKINYSRKFLNILVQANIERDKAESNKTTSIHVLCAILKDDDDNKIKKVLLSAGITYDSIVEEAENIQDEDKKKNKKNELVKFNPTKQLFDAIYGKNKNVEVKIIDLDNIDKEGLLDKMELSGFPGKSPKKSSKKIFDEFCENLNTKAERGLFDNFVGRENEINNLIKALACKKKNSAIIVGSDGVGKTSLVEQLASRIVSKNVPDCMLGKTIYSLNMSAIVSGTQWRGMLESRLKNLIDEIKKNKNIILFIDDISAVLVNSKDKSENETSTILNQALSKGDIQVIGACGYKGFRTTFDSNPTLSRKFQKIIIETPSEDDTIKILNENKEIYEKFHNITYNDNIPELCTKLAVKYIPERNLPDSAIELFDKSGASLRLTINPEIRRINTEIDDLTIKKDKYILEDNIEKKEEIDKQIDKLKIEASEEEKKCKNINKYVTEDTVLNVLSEMTGIPANRLNSNDKKQLSSINEVLKNTIIGQDDAIDKICRSIKRNRVGLSNGKTYASFMLIGKTGVGKTLLAKELAEKIFGDKKNLIRLDMSEYSDESSISKLIGSNPGYVGYDNGGFLTEQIKNKKHCVLLLDEFEKANPKVYNIFLQVFDEGFLTDNYGQKIDFKNVIIILTSNVGTREAENFGRGIGFSTNTDNNRHDILKKELKKKFPPEFLNRLNDIIYFNSLNEDDLKKIIVLEVDKLNDRLKNIGNDLVYDENVIDYLYQKIEKDNDFGARPILRIIQDEIEDKITDMLLEEDYNNHTFNISYNIDNDNLLHII